MNSNFLAPFSFKFSIICLTLLGLYDLEIFFFSSMFLIGHAFKGLLNITNDYVYQKPLKVCVLFYLQLLGIEYSQYIIDFLL